MRFRTAIAAITFASVTVSHAAAAQDQQKLQIHAVANGWHAGILLPATELNKLIPGLRERFPKAANYEIGWGDIGFYQAQEITVRLAIEALLASRGSVLHIVGVPNPIEPFLKGSQVAQACITPDEYLRMSQKIAQSFNRGEDGKIISLRPGIYGDSHFYKAVGTYSILNTCNRWSASVLAAGGLSIDPRISLTASSVLDAMHDHGKPCSAIVRNKLVHPSTQANNK